MRWAWIIAGAIALMAAALLGAWLGLRPTEPADGSFNPPDGAIISYFPARDEERGVPLVISGSMDAGFMRPFLLAFQRRNKAVTIVYLQSGSRAFLDRALDVCHRGGQAADIYLTSSTDHLIRLANENCARTLPTHIGAAAPARAAWRDEVVAFTVEPAAFVFARKSPELRGSVPTNHSQLLDWMRTQPQLQGRIGTYDIEMSGDGYNFAAADSRQLAVYGRLLEALGRSRMRLYCCSNVMVDAVDRGEILVAYNVQLSYAYAAQRAGSRIRVVLPDDFQSLQTVSFMLPKSSRSPETATALAAFLVSDVAREIALRDLAPPDRLRGKGEPQAAQLLAQASVTPVLLSLQDRARREQLIREWREAIARSATGAQSLP